METHKCVECEKVCDCSQTEENCEMCKSCNYKEHNIFNAEQDVEDSEDKK